MAAAAGSTWHAWLVSFEPHRAKTDRLMNKLFEPRRLASDLGAGRLSRARPATAKRYAQRHDVAVA